MGKLTTAQLEKAVAEMRRRRLPPKWIDGELVYEIRLAEKKMREADNQFPNAE